MYSRYTPNDKGGFERRQIPDRAEQHPELQPEPPQLYAAASAEGSTVMHPAGPDPPATPQSSQRGRVPMSPQPPRSGTGAMSPPFRPLPGQVPGGAMRPPPPGSGAFPGGGGFLTGRNGLLGPDGPLGRFLPRGLDSEDFLVLAVLLLAMKEDGSSGTELLIAAALYLFL